MNNSNRLNPKFILLCKLRLDVVEATLAVTEAGNRNPNLWNANQDLESLADCVQGIPDLEKRVEQLGIKYSSLAFSPAELYPPKFLPRHHATPSILPECSKEPISEEEAATIINAVRMHETLDFQWSESSQVISIGGQTYHPSRFRKAIENGVLPGTWRQSLDGMIRAILLAQSRSGVTTKSQHEIVIGLADAFDEGVAWFKRRFDEDRRRLISLSILERQGRSEWHRLIPANDKRINAAVGLLDRMENQGSEEELRSNSINFDENK